MTLNRRPETPLACIVFGLLTGLVTFLLAKSLPTSIELSILGERAVATVTRKELVSALANRSPSLFAMKHSPRYRIEYQFEDPSGTRHSGSFDVGLSEKDRFNVGEQFPVRYLAREPAKNRPARDWPEPFFILAGTLVFGAAFAYIAWLFVTDLLDLTRTVLLVRSGVAVPGIARECAVEMRGRRSRSPVCVVKYEYAYPDPLKTEPVSRSGRFECNGQVSSGWSRGGPVLVLVDPANPGRSTLDYFDARRNDRKACFTTLQ